MESEGRKDWAATLQASLDAIRPMRDAIADITG